MNAARFFLLLSPLLLLSACVDRATADARLLKACSAAIEAFSDEGNTVETVTSKTFSDFKAQGANHRSLEMNVTMSDGFHAYDDTATCIFFEEFGFLKASHSASIYQFKHNGQVIGQENYQIQGSISDMQKLTDAVDKALRL